MSGVQLCHPSPTATRGGPPPAFLPLATLLGGVSLPHFSCDVCGEGCALSGALRCILGDNTYSHLNTELPRTTLTEGKFQPVTIDGQFGIDVEKR